MREEVSNWFKQAKKDLSAARNSLNSGDCEWASFQAHQSVEKSLKALYIKQNNQILKTHDLVLLARKLNAPTEIASFCSKINPHMTFES